MSDIPFDQLPPEVQEGILNGPAVPPPPGWEFDPNQEPNNTMPRILISLALAISLIVFVVRAYTVVLVVKKPHLSDYLMVPTFILFAAFCGILYAEIEHGYFIHIWNYTARDLPSLIYLYINSISLYAISLMLIKVVILLEWLHIFAPVTRNYFFWFGHGLLWLNVLFYVAAILAVNFSCTPREKYWNRAMPGTCIETRPLEITSALINLIVDVGIFLLPQRVIWTLHMPTRRRLGVSAIFSLGILAVVTAGYRTVFTIIKTKSGDLTYDYSLIGLLLVAEITLGIVIFCLPVVPKAIAGSALPGLYKRLLTITGLSTGDRSRKSTERSKKPSWPRSFRNERPSAPNSNGAFVPLEDMAKDNSQTELNHYGYSQTDNMAEAQQNWNDSHPVDMSRITSHHQHK